MGKSEKTGKKQVEKRNFPNKSTQFQKGQSGNPDGRPVGSFNVSTILKELLQQIAPDSIVDSKFVKEFCKENKKATNAHAAAARILFEGIVKGEPWALKEISDRTEGKAPQSLDLTSNGNDLIPQKYVVEVVKN